MAKRYIKISPFYNRPSTAGPLSAERLNAINDGLEAVDTYKIDVDAIVNNGVTTVEGTVLDGRMGKTLQDQVNTLNNNLAQYYKVYNVVDVGGGILTTAGKFIGVTDGKVSYVYLITITDSVGDYYCGIHFYRPTISHAIVKLGGGLDVVVNNQGTVLPTNGTASYEFSVCLLSAK